MRMQLYRTKFPKSCVLLAKKWIKCFSEKIPVKSRKKSGLITYCLFLISKKESDLDWSPTAPSLSRKKKACKQPYQLHRSVLLTQDTFFPQLTGFWAELLGTSPGQQSWELLGIVRENLKSGKEKKFDHFNSLLVRDLDEKVFPDIMCIYILLLGMVIYSVLIQLISQQVQSVSSVSVSGVRTACSTVCKA